MATHRSDRHRRGAYGANIRHVDARGHCRSDRRRYTSRGLFARRGPYALSQGPARRHRFSHSWPVVHGARPPGSSHSCPTRRPSSACWPSPLSLDITSVLPWAPTALFLAEPRPSSSSSATPQLGRIGVIALLRCRTARSRSSEEGPARVFAPRLPTAGSYVSSGHRPVTWSFHISSTLPSRGGNVHAV